MDQHDVITQAFSPLYGEPCWNVQYGWGSFITLEFGEPHLVIDEPKDPLPSWSHEMNKRRGRRLINIRGDWQLWIYCCEWQVMTGAKRIGHSNGKGSSKEPIKRGAKELDGQRLIDVSVDSSRGTSVFTFDLGSRLETKPYNDSIQWKLSEPNGNWLCYRADGWYSHHSGDTLPEHQQYQPMSNLRLVEGGFTR